MTTIQLDAGTLVASASDRTLTGLLVPYGEEARSNLGTFSVDPGTFEIPADLSGMSLNEEHAREAVLGHFVRAEETPAGITATFAVARTEAGDRALQDVAEGKRKHLSAEVAGVVIKAGKAVAGRLFAAALVAAPAFPSATLLASAPDTEDDELAALRDQVRELADALAAFTRTPEEPETDSEEDPETEETPNPESETDVSVIPNTLEASAPADAPLTKRQAIGLFKSVADGTADVTQLARLREDSVTQGTMFAALSDIKYNGTGSVTPRQVVPQWLGEIYSGKTYGQRFVPLFGHQDLLDRQVAGFRWTTKVSGATWAGNKSNIPSSTAATETVTKDAQFWAGGHDHAIEHNIFNTPGYWEGYFAQMAESYARWIDETVVLADVIAASTPLVADNPSGLSIGAGMSALIDGAVEVLANNATPSFAFVTKALYKSILKTGESATLGYLNASLGLEQGSLDGFQFRVAPQLAAGNVLVGAREAATVYELPGNIRVTAPDTVKGGIDTNVIGAGLTFIHKADALIRVTPFGA